jgi:choloylglycine hydrolase
MCIDVMLKPAKDGTVLSTRSLEFGSNLDSGGIVRSPGTMMRSPAPDFESGGLEWRTKYGYVGIEAMHTLVTEVEFLRNVLFTIDGINTEGLACGALWLPGTQYQSDGGEKNRALLSTFFVDWVLGMCKDVTDVRKALQNHDIWVWSNELIEQHVPLHFPVHDRKGNSILVEFWNGSACIYDNPVGVCTNLPEFPWHLTNIRNYINITPENPQPMDIGGFVAQPIGQGQGLQELPGGYSPPSRFIRILMLKNFADQALDARELRVQAVHLLNNTDIIKGTVVGTNTWGGKEYDHNQVTTIRDATHRRFYLKTYDNQQLRLIDLKKVDFTIPGTRTFSIAYDAEAIDISDRANERGVMAA